MRDYKGYDQDMFGKKMKLKDWDFYKKKKKKKKKWEFIYKNAIEILSIMCPYKVISSRKVPSHWITPDIFNLIKEKRALIKRYTSTHDHDTLLALRIHRNELNTTIDKAKASYIIQSLHRTSKNPKKFWRIIKDMIDPSDTVNFVDPVTGNPV